MKSSGRKIFFVLLAGMLFLVLVGNFLYGDNFFTNFEKKDEVFYIGEKGEEKKLLREKIIVNVTANKDQILPKKIIFVAFYKKDKRNLLDFSSLEIFAQQISKYIALQSTIKVGMKEISKEAEAKIETKPLESIEVKVQKEVVLQLVPLEYQEQGFFRENYSIPGEKLANYLSKNNLLNQQDQRLILYSVSNSMDSVAHATKEKVLPENSIYTIVSVDSETSVPPDFNKIEHRLYSFYGSKSWVHFLWKQFFKGEFDSKRLVSKACNVRCFYEEFIKNKPEVVEASIDKIVSENTNLALATLIAEIDRGYAINNDLCSIVFSERKKCWEEDKKKVLPLVFINNEVELKEKEEAFFLKNKDKKRELVWGIDFEEKERCKVQLEAEVVASFNAVRRIFDYISVSKSENKILFPVISDEEKGSSFYYKTFKGALKALGIRYIPYEPERKIIGPFFIPKEDKLYLVILAKKLLATYAKIRIDGEIEQEFDIELPLKYGYEVLKKEVSKYANHSYEIVPANKVSGKTEEIKGKIPTFLIDPTTSYSFFVYGDLRKHDRSKLHAKVRDKQFETSVAYKTKEALSSKHGILHLLTGDLIVDGSSPNDWAEFLDVVLRPLAIDTLMVSSVGNHDLTSSMGVGLFVYRYFFNDAVPHFGNIFYFTKEPYPKGKLSPQKELSPKKFDVKEHIKNTQNWFDVGCVRFIHLPLPTEETRGHYSEIRHSIVDLTRHAITGMTCYNFDSVVWKDFEKNIKFAEDAKKNGKVTFIIIYGHAPLITSPQYEMHHDGIMNFVIKTKFAKKTFVPKESDYDKYLFALEIERIFKNYPIDAYFCGHNHLYDRCYWNVAEGISIPMITIGVGTGLYGLRESKLSMGLREKLESKISSERIICKDEGKAEFIGFVECKVLPDKNIIECDLIGGVGEKGKVKFLGKEPVKTGVVDTFMIHSREAK